MGAPEEGGGIAITAVNDYDLAGDCPSCGCPIYILADADAWLEGPPEAHKTCGCPPLRQVQLPYSPPQPYVPEPDPALPRFGPYPKITWDYETTAGHPSEKPTPEAT